MIDEIEFKDVSGDPKMAFVRLEAKLRTELERKFDEEGRGLALDYIKYLNSTYSLSNALGLDLFKNKYPPHLREEYEKIYYEYTTCTLAIDSFAISAKITFFKNQNSLFVLSNSEKSKIRHYVNQIKTALQESSVATEKKEALFTKINEFLEEMDRDRTTVQAYADLMISLARNTGNAFREIEPAWKWFSKVAELIGSKRDDVLEIESTHRKQIEGPKGRLPKPELLQKPSPNDEIPF